MNILFVINNGFEESETICPYDILKRAGHDVTISSNNENIIGAHGLSVSNLKLLKNLSLNDYDLVVLPGGPQWKENITDKLYLQTIKYFIENKSIAAICASPTIIGNLGYLKNKKYTCFPPMNKNFGGNFTGSDAEIDGNIITGRSAGSSLLFGYKILEYLEGKEKVDEIKKSMFY